MLTFLHTNFIHTANLLLVISNNYSTPSCNDESKLWFVFLIIGIYFHLLVQPLCLRTNTGFIIYSAYTIFMHHYTELCLTVTYRKSKSLQSLINP